MPTLKKALVLAVVLLVANVVKSASVSLAERNSAVIIASKVAVAVETVAETIETKTSAAMISAATTIARKSDATTEVVISEAATTAVHATVVTALLLIQTVRAHEAGTVVQEVKTEVVQKANRAENATRSTKLSCILGV
jgi:hypothetical protein